jgi:AcrR family transcriptional regulator
MELFLAQGFDSVTTTEVARAAGVSPATLFNYFETKEDLFFGQVRQLEVALTDLVRSCPPGESILLRLRSHVLFELSAGRNETRPADVATFHHQVALSSRLQAREHEVYDRRERVLAAAIAETSGPDADPLAARVAARLYIAAEQLIANELRDQMSRVDPRSALRDIEPFIDRVFAIMAAGIGQLPSSRTDVVAAAQSR